MPDPSPEWRSFHLYFFNESKKDELVVRMGEHLHRLRADKLVAGWFFIRYWDGGPHIRLRVKCVEASMKHVDLALADLSRFMLEHKSAEFDAASFIDATSAFRDSSSTFEMHNEGDIVATAYEPEYDRYGGPDLMPLTDELFQLSSDVAVDVLSRPSSFSEKLLWSFALMRELSTPIFSHPLLSQNSARLCRDNIEFWSSKGISPSEPCVRLVSANPAALAKVSSYLRRNPGTLRLLESMEARLGRLLDELARSRFAHPGYTATSHLHMLNNRMGCDPRIESAFYQVLLDSHSDVPSSLPGSSS